MDAAGVSAKPSTAQDTVSLSHQKRRCCGVSCAGRRGAKWLGNKRGLSESLGPSFFSVCSRWSSGKEDGVWRRLLVLPTRAAELPALFSLPPRPRRRGPVLAALYLSSSRITVMALQISIVPRLRSCPDLSRFRLSDAFSIAGAPAVSGHDE
jgi:hypothetical protein